MVSDGPWCTSTAWALTKAPLYEPLPPKIAAAIRRSAASAAAARSPRQPQP